MLLADKSQMHKQSLEYLKKTLLSSFFMITNTNYLQMFLLLELICFCPLFPCFKLNVFLWLYTLLAIINVPILMCRLTEINTFQTSRLRCCDFCMHGATWTPGGRRVSAETPSYIILIHGVCDRQSAKMTRFCNCGFICIDYLLVCCCFKFWSPGPDGWLEGCVWEPAKTNSGR